MINAIARLFRTQSLTIANGATTSDVLNASEYSAFGVVIPATFTGTSISFSVSADGSTYQNLYDISNIQVTVTVAASRSYDLPTALSAWPWIKIVSNAAETGARTLKVTCKA